MTTKDIEVTRVYSGSFTWDESELRKSIAQFDMHFTVPYCPTDPRTWPLVQSVTRDIRKNKVLPSRVVYSMAFMNSQRLVTLRKLSYYKCGNSSRLIFFLLFHPKDTDNIDSMILKRKHIESFINASHISNAAINLVCNNPKTNIFYPFS